MNKAELIDGLANATGLSKTEASLAVEALTDLIVDALARGEKVSIHGFGAFSAATRAERKGRNPSTGEDIRLPARVSPKFTAGTRLREATAGVSLQ